MRLIEAFSKGKVLDLFVFMTQEFTDPLHKKLAIHFMEIAHFVFRNFTPGQVVNH